MTQPKNSKDLKENIDKKDTFTYTAYGDPIKDTPPTINNQYTEATSPIADSTQNVSSGRTHPDTKKHDTAVYGDTIIDTSSVDNDKFKLASSTIAKSTQSKNTKLPL